MEKGHYYKKAPKGLRKWMKFENYGTAIKYIDAGGSQQTLKLLPFKCPLDDNHDQFIPKMKRLYPEDLFGHYYRNDIVLKFVIDLSNTEKYYDPQSFENVGVKHFKLPIAGLVTPNEEFMTEFYTMIANLQSQLKENEFIGLHCTHGVNRTGYMIVRYLCEKVGLDLEQALEAFNNSRAPHALYKECLLADLNQRFKQ